MAHEELDLRERRRIEDILNAKLRVSWTAAEIGRHRAPVYREIKRNAFAARKEDVAYLDGYYGMVAQRKAFDRRSRRRELIRLVDLREAVIDRLKAGWSPAQIAARMCLEGLPVTVSHEAIYAHVYGPEGRAEELAGHLPSRRKKRRPRYARRSRNQVFPPERSIHQRTEYVKHRETFGE